MNPLGPLEDVLWAGLAILGYLLLYCVLPRFPR